MRIFIDIGAFRPGQQQIDAIRVDRSRDHFDVSIPPRARAAEIKRYALKQAAERFLEFFVPSLIAALLLRVVYDWIIFFGSLAVTIVVSLGVALWLYRRIIDSLDPLRTAWEIVADTRETRVYCCGDDGREPATVVSFSDLHGMNSHRIEDDVFFDYMHDQFSNELELTSSRGGVRFAEGLDFDTCEEIVTQFGKYVEILRAERAIADMPGIYGLDK